MQIDLPDVVAEVRSAFDIYEKALVSNDVETLDALFHDDARTIRYGGGENLYGYAAIKAFRSARSPAGLARSIEKTAITTYGRDFAIASTLFRRASSPGKIGRQMQTWVRFDEGWRVVAAHVSVIDDPEGRRMSILALSRTRSAACRKWPQDAGRGAAAAARRRDRARRAGAGHRARRNRTRGAFQRVAHAGARGDPPARGQRLDRCARPHRGAVVARPDEERLVGMFEAMGELEALCAGLAAERMLPAERSALEATHEKLRALIHVGDPQSHHEANEAFHGIIYAGAHNDYLAEMAIATRARVQPFRRAQFRNLGRLAKSYSEHDRVVAAILRGDRPAAAAAMHSHILTVREEYEAYIQSL